MPYTLTLEVFGHLEVVGKRAKGYRDQPPVGLITQLLEHCIDLASKVCLTFRVDFFPF